MGRSGADGFEQRSLVEFAEVDDERFETARVRRLKRIDVSRTVVPEDDQWESAALEQDKGRKRPCDAAVPVLKRMDLNEAVMEPRCGGSCLTSSRRRLF